MAQKFAGRDGFLWFFGVVEDINDPLMRGRVKVRCYSYHEEDKTILPTDFLMWARIGQPTTSAAVYPDQNLNQYANNLNGGIGWSPTGLLNGSVVFGFFADDGDCQLPFIICSYGSMSGDKADICQLAIGNNTIQDNTIGPEPNSSYAAVYPFNHVFSAQCGHVLEMDSTPDHERIRLYHKAGSYFEFSANGQVVNKAADNSYEIVVKDKEVYIAGNLHITVLGDAKINVRGNLDAEVQKDANVSAQGAIGVDAGQDLNISAAHNVNINAGGVINLKSGQAINADPPVSNAIFAQVSHTDQVD